MEKQRAEATALVRDLLARLQERADVRELAVTRGDVRVRVRKGGESTARAASAGGRPPAAELAEELGSEVRATVADFVEVKAPLNGVFYRGPSPNAPPYVQVGSTVSVGQVIGLIEAMKLFNEIRSTAAGRVRRVLAENGQLVRAQSVLIEVEPL